MAKTEGGQLPEAVSIHLRPPEANDRAFPWNWEGDLLKGAANRLGVGVLVERSSRLVCSPKLKDATAVSALEGFTATQRKTPKPMRKTLTCDRDREMARHPEQTEATGIRVCFCDPRSPWQRGSCENINGLLRQYLPKGTNLSVYSQEGLDAIADRLGLGPAPSMASTPRSPAARPCCRRPPKPAAPFSDSTVALGA